MRALVVAMILTVRAAAAQVAAPIVDDRPAAPGAVDAGRALVEAGTLLGEDNKYELALGKFLLAAGEHPSATHDCFVALAYLRIGRLTLARLWIDASVRRGDERPIWCATKIADELSRALEMRGFVEVTFAVEPADAEVWVADSQFRGGRSVWSPPGPIEVRAEAAGYEPRRQSATAKAGARISLVLERPTPAPLAPSPRPRRSPAAWISLIGGGAALAGGAVFHVLAVRTRDEANGELQSSARFGTLDDRFVRQRAIAIAGYAVGGAALAVGVWLFTRERASEPHASLVIEPGQIGFAWSWVR